MIKWLWEYPKYLYWKWRYRKTIGPWARWSLDEKTKKELFQNGWQE